MTRQSLSNRGPYAAPGAKLPALQAARIADPETNKAIEALREWVEVRLGSRGDKYEKAVTLREFERLLADVFAKVDQLSAFDGTLSALEVEPVSAVPTDLRKGFTQVGDDLYYCNGKTWKKVTFTP
jgi:hypothetical protein